jgi:hypothetical protein
MARTLNETLRKYYRPGGRKEFLQDLAQTLAMLAVLALTMM